jgi:hypothetical protein
VDLLLFIVEQVIKTSDKQHSEELKRIGEMESDGGTDSEYHRSSGTTQERDGCMDRNCQITSELNDAACGIAAEDSGMHTIMRMFEHQPVRDKQQCRCLVSR